jgi:DNA-binding transcriptional MerR regulator
MIKIGDFARLSRVTPRTLRYYEEVGLLKPSEVDRWTSYRFYELDQLPRLNRILALKDLGFSLEEIARLLDEEITPEQLRGMLKMKQAELRTQVREAQERLERVEDRLSQIEREMTMATNTYEITIKKVEAQRVAMARGIVPNMEVIGPTLDRLFDEAIGHAQRHDARFAGAPVTIYFEVDEKMEDMSVGAAVPTSDPLPDSERVKVETLPAVEQMASVVHRGPFATLNEAYNALFEWLGANGYRTSGPGRELNLEYQRGGDQSKYVTEVQFPVEKA